MPKYKIKNEQILNEFLDNFFSVVAKKRGKKAMKSLENDPEIKRIRKKYNNLRDELEQHIKDNPITYFIE